MSPQISIVMPARNEANRLIGTIQSIVETRTIQNLDIEIVIVDDASTDGCCDNLISEGSQVSIKVVRSEERLGVPAARNLGASQATGEILFITDSHVKFCRNWDVYVLENIREGRILAATVTDSASAFKGYGCRLAVPAMGTSWNRTEPAMLTPVEVAACPGTVLYRQLFQKIGGYDAGMIIYGAAEPEFSIRAWLSGAEIVAVPPLEVQHRFKPKSERTTFLDSVRTFMVHNSLRFGLLYLNDLASLQVMRYYSLNYPEQIQVALQLLQNSDLWQRREVLESTLQYDFDWFVQRFDVVNQVGQTLGEEWGQAA